MMKFGERNKINSRVLEAIGSRSGSAYILLSEPDHIPIYVSDSIKSLMGLDPADVMADIYALQWCATDEGNRNGQRIFENLDLTDNYQCEFDFKHLVTDETKHARVVLSSAKGAILIEICDMSAEVDVRNALRSELEKVKTEEMQKSDYLSKMSHEIRTPMNGILGMLTLAKNNIGNSEELLKCLDKANSLSQFLLSLINDILDMSKIERGKVVLESEKTDLLGIFNKLKAIFANMIEQKGITFDTRLENMEIRYVMSDELRLMQILTNFLSNAYKYTDRGGTIELVFREMNKSGDSVHMMFRIKDNGKGMDPKFLSRIFKPFEQESASTTRKFGGTGLGMAIADNLVTIMGGHIVVDTAVGRGSEFSVYIPLKIADCEQSWDSENVQKASVGKALSLSGMRVLLAEDNAINAEIVSEILAQDGVVTDIADDGEKVIEKFKASKPGYYDIIFMDIQMPKKDGWTAAAEIRSLAGDYAQKIPIYAMSANAFVEDKRHSVEVGMNGHISKPIDFETVRKILGQCGRSALRMPIKP